MINTQTGPPANLCNPHARACTLCRWSWQQSAPCFNFKGYCLFPRQLDQTMWPGHMYFLIHHWRLLWKSTRKAWIFYTNIDSYVESLCSFPKLVSSKTEPSSIQECRKPRDSQMGPHSMACSSITLSTTNIDELANFYWISFSVRTIPIFWLIF